MDVKDASASKTIKQYHLTWFLAYLFFGAPRFILELVRHSRVYSRVLLMKGPPGASIVCYGPEGMDLINCN